MVCTADDVRKATQHVLSNGWRIQNHYGRPGGLIDLTDVDRELVIIGDLHGAHDNLVEILKHEEVERRVRDGQAILVFLGDGPHNDQTGFMLEMESSLLVMDEVMRLLIDYQDSIVYIRGNHDTFEERLAKSGIQQGLEFRKHSLKARGQEYTDALEAFFDALPYAILGKEYIIVHAGPVRNGCSREDLINLEDNPDYMHQLAWNRVHELRGGTPSLREYDQSDVEKMLQKLGLPKDAYFIVGHNPLWQTGNLTGVWKDVVGIKNHIILYTNLATEGPYLVLKNGVLEEKYGVNPKVTPSGYYGR